MQKHDQVLAILGKRLRKLRDVSKLTQEKLAERAELDPTYISGIERGVRNPGIKNIVRIAKALGVTASRLVEGVGE